MHHYRIHGLDVASDLVLPDARAAAGGGGDVRITAAPDVIPCVRDDVTLRGDSAFATLYLPDAATFAFERGGRIAVTPHSDDAETVRAFLLGSAWAVLLHQREMLPLHGCALEWEGRARLFVGERGAGKSTLAAALLRAGARLVSDDVTAVDLSGGIARTWPGLRSMKLAAADPALGDLLGPTIDEGKVRIVPHNLSDDAALPLAAIVELARGPSTRIDRLRGSAACGVAVRHTFRGVAAARLGQGAPHLAACVALTGVVPVHRLERAWDIDGVAATADRLMRDPALA